MIITQSSVAMASRQELYIRHSRQESLTMWQDGRAPANGAAPPTQGTDKVTISPQAQKAQPVSKTMEEELPLSDKDKMEIELIRRMVEMLTGRKLRMVTVSDYLKAHDKASEDAARTASAIQQQQQTEGGQPPPEGWGMIYQAQESHFEQESTAFAATGKVRTADGREIDIEVSLSMSRQFMEENSLEIRAGDAARLTDPLVVNFGGSAAQLSQTKYQFDLDSNGVEEQVSFVQGESGLLALDKNNDGTINNGNELFGPKTGNGFQELARHDQDGNQWIDENDDIYSKLRIWTKAEDGSDQLFALGQKGIGALYLGNIQSEFSLKDSSNALLGQVRSTGLYLREDGGAGTMQQIDLAV